MGSEHSPPECSSLKIGMFFWALCEVIGSCLGELRNTYLDWVRAECAAMKDSLLLLDITPLVSQAWGEVDSQDLRPSPTLGQLIHGLCSFTERWYSAPTLWRQTSTQIWQRWLPAATKPGHCEQFWPCLCSPTCRDPPDIPLKSM